MTGSKCLRSASLCPPGTGCPTKGSVSQGLDSRPGGGDNLYLLMVISSNYIITLEGG